MNKAMLQIILIIVLYIPVYGAEYTTSERLTRLETWRESHNEALNLETSELRRRLDILNGEADRLREMQATYLPRESYQIEHDRLRKDVEELQGFRNNLIGQMAMISTFFSIIVFLIFKHYFK